jgi:small subunit ribosomal protein S14
MARKAIVDKQQKKQEACLRAIRDGRKPKFSTRIYNRCQLCGRVRGYMGFFGICRICFRELASNGEIPGVTKSSW